MDIPTATLTREELKGDMESLLKRGFADFFGEDGPPAKPDKPIDLSMAQVKGDKRLGELATWASSARTSIADGDIIEPLAGGDFNIRPLEEVLAEQETASMQQGLGRIAGTLDGALGAKIPWGSILIGALPGLFVHEVIDGTIEPRTQVLDALGNPIPDPNDPTGFETNINWPNPLLKIGLAAVVSNFGTDFIGRRPSMLFSGTLLVLALADILPIDQWVAKVVDTFKGGTAPVAQDHSVAAARRLAAQDQAEAALRDRRDMSQHPQPSSSDPLREILG